MGMFLYLWVMFWADLDLTFCGCGLHLLFQNICWLVLLRKLLVYTCIFLYTEMGLWSKFFKLIFDLLGIASLVYCRIVPIQENGSLINRSLIAIHVSIVSTFQFQLSLHPFLSDLILMYLLRPSFELFLLFMSFLCCFYYHSIIFSPFLLLVSTKISWWAD